MADVSRPLEARLTTSMTIELHQAILTKLFEMDSTEEKPRALAEAFGSFNHWYEEKCSGPHGTVSKMSHGQLLDIVALVKDGNATYDSIKLDIIRMGIPHLNTETEVQTSLILAARIWSLSTIGVLDQCQSFGNSVEWQSGTLAETLNRNFTPVTNITECIVLPEIFRAIDIDQIAGIRICWTNNLLDHLRMSGDDSVVHIFHHASILKLHQKSNSKLLPAKLIDETLDTLALLFPQIHQPSRKWFQKLMDKKNLDPAALSNGQLDSSRRRLNGFQFWGDRLLILKEAFDRSEPKTVRQWWYDDRKRVQWWTFWIAVLVLLLTVVFGLIQSIASVIQAWATIRSLDRGAVAQKQPI